LYLSIVNRHNSTQIQTSLGSNECCIPEESNYLRLIHVATLVQSLILSEMVGHVIGRELQAPNMLSITLNHQMRIQKWKM